MAITPSLETRQLTAPLSSMASEQFATCETVDRRRLVHGYQNLSLDSANWRGDNFAARPRSRDRTSRAFKRIQYSAWIRSYANTFPRGNPLCSRPLRRSRLGPDPAPPARRERRTAERYAGRVQGNEPWLRLHETGREDPD